VFSPENKSLSKMNKSEFEMFETKIMVIPSL
jgi:hypothetical protein